MENIYLYYIPNKDSNLLNIVFSYSLDVDITNRDNIIVSYICNNYYKNNDEFINISNIKFNEQYKTNLQNFIKFNGNVVVINKTNINIIDENNKNIFFNGANGSKMDLARQMKLQC